MKNNKELEKLRSEMHECINKYGICDKRTLVASQKLDKLVTLEQLVIIRVEDYFV
jgi:hypothetical protein